MTGLHDILQEIAANTGNQATEFRSMPNIYIPGREPSTGVVSLPEDVTLKCFKEPLRWKLGYLTSQTSLEARDGAVGAVMAAAMSMERKTLERRRAYHLEIT